MSITIHLYNHEITPLFMAVGMYGLNQCTSDRPGDDASDLPSVWVIGGPKTSDYKHLHDFIKGNTLTIDEKYSIIFSEVFEKMGDITNLNFDRVFAGKQALRYYHLAAITVVGESSDAVRRRKHIIGKIVKFTDANFCYVIANDVWHDTCVALKYVNDNAALVMDDPQIYFILGVLHVNGYSDDRSIGRNKIAVEYFTRGSELGCERSAKMLSVMEARVWMYVSSTSLSDIK